MMGVEHTLLWKQHFGCKEETPSYLQKDVLWRVDGSANLHRDNLIPTTSLRTYLTSPKLSKLSKLHVLWNHVHSYAKSGGSGRPTSLSGRHRATEPRLFWLGITPA